ncbi:universal stress protein [Planococcus beigongshangi]|uniref:universal stress protein n=1 Tax=Planococcus beigongshangi TaxID=2782536 RepID=UPI00193BDCD6
MYKKILLASDGSENSLRAAREAVYIALLEQEAEVTVLYVIDHKEAESEEIHKNIPVEVELARKKKVQPIIDLLEKEQIFYKLELIYGIPSKVISEYANEGNIDLLVMGKRGLNPMQEMVLGSVSRSVLNKVDAPALVVK